ncbi:MAG: serine hydrolase domain-containing protein, partial [Bacteroidota bacterium]
MIPKFRFSLLVFLLLGLTQSTVFSQSGLVMSGAEPVDLILDDYISTQQITGASIAIAKDGNLFYTKGFGTADEATSLPMQPYNRLRIAGLSKTITAIAIYQLIEDGSLELDDKVFGEDGILNTTTYLSFDITDDRVYDITIQQLLEHSAGWDASEDCLPFSNNGCDPIFFPLEASSALGASNPASTSTLIGFALELGLEFDPGADFAYSNIGYLVLGEVISEVAGQSYTAYVTENVFNPLNICDISAGNTLTALEREAFYNSSTTALSAFGGGETVSAPYGQFPLESLTSSNGWVANAEDLLKILIDLNDNNPTLLNTTSLQSLLTASSNNAAYANGIQVDNQGNIWSQGTLPGVTAAMGSNADGFTWVLLTNQDEFINSDVTADDDAT